MVPPSLTPSPFYTPPSSCSFTPRYANAMWLRCVDEDNRLYLDSAQDVALLNTAVHTDQDLSVENVTRNVDDGRSSPRSRNKAKRKGRGAAVERATADFLRLSDSGFQSIIRAGLSHFA